MAEIGSTEAVKQSVKSGLGLSVLSRLAVKEELLKNTLKEVKIADFIIDRALYIVTNRLRTKTPLSHAFLEFLLNKS